MECLNLRELFGDQYRITWDEAYGAAHVPHDRRDPWMMALTCTGHGVMIYPHGGAQLAVEVDRRPSIVARLAALSGVRLWQDGDTEKTFLFDICLFDQIARIVKPRKRRMLTDAHRQVLAKYAFSPRSGAQKSTLKQAPASQAGIFIT